MAATADGGGYWLVALRRGVFPNGDAAFHGSMGGKALHAPRGRDRATPDGGGYWLVASDGGGVSFGDAAFYGSTGALRLVQPVTGMAATPDGGGYWLVASDGGVFSFGDAAFEGSLPGARVSATGVALLPTLTGAGYLIRSRPMDAPWTSGTPPQLGDVADVVVGPYRATSWAEPWVRDKGACSPAGSGVTGHHSSVAVLGGAAFGVADTEGGARRSPPRSTRG